MLRMQPDRQIDPVAIEIRLAGDDGKILFLHGAVFELRRQSQMSLVVLGHDDHAAGIAVEPMDDSRTGWPAHVAQGIEVELQRAGERAVPVPFAGMNDHAGGLLIAASQASS